MSNNFKAPETVNELKERIKALEAKINHYNEIILLSYNQEEDQENSELSIDQDEMDIVYEEYRFLNEIAEINKVDLTLNEDQEIKETDETIDEKTPKSKSIIDEIGLWFYIVSIILLVLSYNYFMTMVGMVFIEMMGNATGISDFFKTRQDYQIKLFISVIFLIYPLFILLISYIFRWTLVRNKTMRLIYTIFQLVLGASLLGNFLYILFSLIW